ncbi:flavin reductase family protein [Methanobacterium spitsbergense]|uniref:Flavin reductase family protein n=1 Tax=Methanobacterium spitsbergense TaxID=2874285 RepID=A0A8T5UP22_9EURY|nr:flavin reductase family protein [Methanobacterium spitsbergense]MBZ2165538.1 flavin reductase family protein [Methanobacterium spitsbergense]
MSKINIGKNVFTQTMPVTLIGSKVEGKTNFMTLAWVTRVNSNPPLFGVAINKVHHSSKDIIENKTFSINFPSEDLLIETDYCGLVSGRKTDKSDKSDIFNVFYGELETAPMITECAVSIECKLFDVVELPTNNLFIGEAVAAYSEEQYLTDNKLDIKKINPLILTMPDNNYWKVGDHAGNAWNAGKNFKQ